MTKIEKAKELIGTFATGDAEKAASPLTEGYIQITLHTVQGVMRLSEV